MRRPLIPFNGMALGLGMVRNLHVRDAVEWSNCRPYDGPRQEVKIHPLLAVQLIHFSLGFGQTENPPK
jgi:hypothetical protein